MQAPLGDFGVRIVIETLLHRAVGLRLAAAATVCIQASLAAPSARSEDFYHGKTLTVLVGYAAGGGYDINARLLARHLGDHIPGHPSIIVENMPGAGSLKMLGFLSHKAPTDGTTIGLFDFTQITNSLLTPDTVKTDFRQYKWVGSIAQDLAVCYVWNRTKASSLAQVQKIPSLPMGRTNAGTSSDIEQKILRKLFDVHVRSVAGYEGSSQAFIAVENGELDGGCLTWGSLPPSWISGKRITPILRLSKATAPDLPADVPDAIAIAKSPRDRQIIEFLTAAGKLGKPIVASPATPQAQVDVLRKAFEVTMTDPNFLADAAKARQPVSPVSGVDAENILRTFYATPAEVVAAARAVVSD
jgi:tripartite-type tricarboxylate transporter receptor subunit TctC